MWQRLRSTRLEPNDPKEIVSETLVEALNIATNTNLSLRSTEALQTFLQRCDELNERELIGLCKIVSDLSMLGKSNVGGILLDLLKHVVRTGTKETETRQRNDTKMRFSDDSHWLRITKAGVKPLTFLVTHKKILMVLMDEADPCARHGL